MSFPEPVSTETVDQPREGGEPGQKPPPPSLSARRVVGLITALVGASLVFLACLGTPLLIGSIVVQGASYGTAVEQAAGPFVLVLGIGSMMALEGWRVWRGQSSPVFYPRRLGLLGGGLLILVLVGLLLSVAGGPPSFLLAPLNAVTMLLLPLLVVGGVGRLLRGHGGTWRDVLTGLMGGATIGTGLAMIAEVVLVVLAVAVVIGLGILPADVEELEALVEEMSDPALLLEPEQLAQFVTPAVVVGALGFVAVATPLIEEAVKTLWLGVAGIWLRPSPPRAFLLGVASGAGFALVENVLNGAFLTSFWAVGVFSRLAATFMHCATGGLVGWGWGQLWTERRFGRWALASGGAVLLHGLWNGLVVGTVASGLQAAANTEDLAAVTTSGLAATGMLLGLLLLAVVTLVGLLLVSRKLGRRESTSEATVLEDALEDSSAR